MSQLGFIRTHQSVVDIIQRLSDALLLVGTLWLSVWLSDYQWGEREGVAALAGVLVFYFLAEMNGLYDSWRGASVSLELRYLLWSWFWTVLILLLFAFITKVSELYSRQIMLIWFLLVPLTIGFWRQWIRFLLKNLRHIGYNTRRLVIVGANDLGKRLLSTIRTHPSMGFTILGFYDDNLERGASFESLEVKGSLKDLIEDAKKGEIDSVYITLPMNADSQIKKLVSDLADNAITVYLVPDLFVFELLHSRWQDVGGLPVVSIYGSPFLGVGGFLKRMEDVILSLLILLLMAIPMLIIALGVKLTSPGPFLFKQRRYGLGGEKIWVWKFRSMTVCENGKITQAKRDDDRVTAFGRFLRRTSLDELPQFINVLQGQMSVVGPRPHAISHNEEYRPLIHRYMLRHMVKPGITGLAQIHGCRGQTDLPQMVERIHYDLDYIDNWSLWLDIKIVFLTIFKGFVHKNAY